MTLQRQLTEYDRKSGDASAVRRHARFAEALETFKLPQTHRFTTRDVEFREKHDFEPEMRHSV